MLMNVPISFDIKIKKVDPNAKIPRYAKPGDAGLDLFAVSMERTKNYIEYDTGIALEIPDGYVGIIFPRSSNSKKDLILANSAGVIDSGYRGTIKLRYKYNTHARKVVTYNQYNIGDAIGQIIILPYPKISFVEVDELEPSERGEDGFGSTDKKQKGKSMRGKTCKKLKKFVNILIENTPEDERTNQSHRQLYQSMKKLWYSEGKRGRKFIDFVNSGNLTVKNLEN